MYYNELFLLLNEPMVMILGAFGFEWPMYSNEFFLLLNEPMVMTWGPFKWSVWLSFNQCIVQSRSWMKRSRFSSKGKSIDANYNVTVHESNPSHYQLSADIIVIHCKIYKLQRFTTLVNTPITLINLAECTHVFIRVVVAHRQGEGSSFMGNHQSWCKLSANIESIFITKLERRNETT
jgi:hypothetical protein